MIKILIVDDHQEFRRGLHFMLEELLSEVEITEMTSGNQFISELNTISPNLIFMDIRMPGINGLKAASIALKQNPKLRIIMLTMFLEGKYLNEAKAIGIKSFLIKPPTLSQLKQAYNTAMCNES